MAHLLLAATVEIATRNELHRFAVIPKRWVVERSFAWLEKCRRLWKNCERKFNTSLPMTVLAFLSLLSNPMRQDRAQADPNSAGKGLTWAAKILQRAAFEIAMPLAGAPISYPVGHTAIDFG